jgi:hypothetical protein
MEPAGPSQRSQFDGTVGQENLLYLSHRLPYPGPNSCTELYMLACPVLNSRIELHTSDVGATKSMLPATYFMFVALNMGFFAADNVWARLWN